MRLDFSNSWQLSAFLFAVILGSVFCVIYDLIRVMLRNFNSGGLVVFIADVTFFALFGIATFCFFMLFSKGTIRLYILLGEALGFLAVRWLISSYLRNMVIIIQVFLNKLIAVALLPIKFLIKQICKVVNIVKAFIGKSLKLLKIKMAIFIKIKNKNQHKSKNQEKSLKKPKKVAKKPCN